MNSAPLEPPAVSLLKRSELFNSLTDEDLHYFASRSSFLTVPRGSGLFHSGDFAKRFFVVKDGSIRVFRRREDGSDEIMALFAPGDAVGDFDFARGAAYDAHAEALVDSEIVAFPGRGLGFEDLARERPSAAARLKLRSLAMIASRLRSTNNLISENAPWVRELRRRAYEDPATGLWSRAFLDEEIAANLRGTTAVVVLKPMRFKDLVDERGHAAGDVAMARIAAVLKKTAERFGQGWAVRVRSNETALVVPAAAADDAEKIAETVRREFAGIDPFEPDCSYRAWTFSAALAYASWPEDGKKWDALFGAVYDACIEAWKNGESRPIRALP